MGIFKHLFGGHHKPRHHGGHHGGHHDEHRGIFDALQDDYARRERLVDYPPQQPPLNNPNAGAACPNCGAANAVNARFCQGCGAALVAAAAPPVARQCSNCGTPLAPNAQFCNQCGQKQ